MRRRTPPWTHRLARSLHDLLYGVRLVGPANAWRALLYSLRPRGPEPSLPQPALPTGPPQAVQPIPHGVQVHFAQATLRLTFLSPEGLRLTWEPGPPVPDWGRPRWPEPLPPVTWEPTADGLGRVRTARLSVRITPHGLHWRVGDDGPWHRLPWPQRTATGWQHAWPLPAEAAVFGLGLRATRRTNLRPGRYRLWNQDPGGAYDAQRDPLYLGIPLVWVLTRDGPPYLWFYENPADGRVDLDEHVRFAFTGGPAQAVLFVGPPRLLARRWAQYSGFPPLPPRWALGFHQSRWGYRTQAEVEAVLEGYRRRGWPLHALHLDIDHMDRRRVFTVDARRFPDPAGLSRKAAAQGVHLVAIVDPGVPADPSHPTYRRGQQGDHFCRDAQGREVRAPVWPGWCVFPDFSRAATRAWWATEYAALWAWGVRGVWHDMNEPATFAAWGDPTLPPDTLHRTTPPLSHRLYHNLYGLHMNQAGFEAQRRAHPQRRPWLLSRSGWAGVQRYAWNWAADQRSTWDGLAQVVPQTLNLSLSGQPYTGPDIGGFTGDPAPDLYLRWFQLAAWLPFFRLHSSIAARPREPWHFPRPVQRAVARALRTRVRWLPYWYTCAWHATRTGEPLVRPLWWEAPRRTDLWAVDDAFLVGPALRVQVDTAFAAGARPAALVDPGPDWHPLPVWPGLQRHLRRGLAVPLAEDRGRALVWLLAPPTSDAAVHGQVYLDAGDGAGPARVLTWHGHRRGDRLHLTLHSRGAYPFPYAGHRLRVLGPAGHARRYDLPLPAADASFTVEIPLP